jgi:sugar lactone lactonase YvrE
MHLAAARSDGALYCFDTPGSARRLDTGFLVSNGLGWSPDDKTMYFTDTGLGVIYAYDFDLETGEPTRRRLFAQIDPDMGRPDGLTVDAEGYLWVALWDGWRVVRLAPDGSIDREIVLPVPRPTSCCFGGTDLRTLYITSARVRLTRETLAEAPMSGGIFSLKLGVAGQATVPAFPEGLFEPHDRIASEGS